MSWKREINSIAEINATKLQLSCKVENCVCIPLYLSGSWILSRRCYLLVLPYLFPALTEFQRAGVFSPHRELQDPIIYSSFCFPARHLVILTRCLANPTALLILSPPLVETEARCEVICKGGRQRGCCIVYVGKLLFMVKKRAVSHPSSSGPQPRNPT